jgi:hypothetical protein
MYDEIILFIFNFFDMERSKTKVTESPSWIKRMLIAKHGTLVKFSFVFEDK